MDNLYKLLPVIFLISSCTHEPIVPIKYESPNDLNLPDTIVNGNRPCNPDTMYFEEDILPIFVGNCAISGCHGAQFPRQGIELNNYTNIINTGKIKPGRPNDNKLIDRMQRTNPDDRMPPPPYPRLSKEQIDKVVKWITQGAKDLPCDDCNLENIGYASTIKPILAECTGCHSRVYPEGNIRLDNYKFVYTVATNGKLLGAIAHQQGFVPMPQDSPKLSDCKILQIKKWVDAGAPNN